MRVWMYARLSNDDDRERNSLHNQQQKQRVFPSHSFSCQASKVLLRLNFKSFTS